MTLFYRTAILITIFWLGTFNANAAEPTYDCTQEAETSKSDICQQVDQYFRTIEDAINNKDLSALLNQISEVVLFHLDYIENGENKHYHLNKKQYEEWAQSGFEVLKKYQINLLQVEVLEESKKFKAHIEINVTTLINGKSEYNTFRAKEVLWKIDDELTLIEYFQEPISVEK